MKIEIDYNGAFAVCNIELMEEPGKMEDFTDTMSNVYSTSVCPETIDESPMAYKPMQEIIDQIGDTVEVIDIRLTTCHDCPHWQDGDDGPQCEYPDCPPCNGE